MSQPPRTLSQIKRAFLDVVQNTISECGMGCILPGKVILADVCLYAEKIGSDWYFLKVFIDENNRLDRQKLKDFVHENISEFSFYQSDVV